MKYMWIWLKRLFFKLLRKNPAIMPMVRYWKRAGAVQAKVVNRNGVTSMVMDGEDEVFPGFPRGYLLFGKLSKLKHEIKNQVFNESWAALEDGVSDKEVARRVRKTLDENILPLLEDTKYDRVPPEKMAVPVREIHRAWKKIAPDSTLCDAVCFIIQEDDSYRFRFQWMVQFMATWSFFFRDPVPLFDRALDWLEHGEVIGDMKERVRLFRRIMVVLLRDPKNRAFFTALFREIDWKKVRLGRAEKYFFRGKYFKVDLDKFEY